MPVNDEARKWWVSIPGFSFEDSITTVDGFVSPLAEPDYWAYNGDYLSEDSAITLYLHEKKAVLEALIDFSERHYGCLENDDNFRSEWELIYKQIKELREHEAKD